MFNNQPTNFFNVGNKIYNLKSWIFWIVIIIVIIILIIWLVGGSQTQEFVGYKPLIPGVKPSEVMNRDTMILLGISDENPPRNPFSAQNLSNRLNKLTQQRIATPIINKRSVKIDDPGSTPVIHNKDSLESFYSSNSTISDVPSYRDLDIGTFEDRKISKESKGERICRQFLEKYYKVPFPRVRPDFLKNPLTNRNLELDGYNSSLNIAFEYQGYQHYVYPNHYHSNEGEFYQQKARDKFKLQVCDMAGVYLITVPYTIRNELIPKFIYKRLPHRYVPSVISFGNNRRSIPSITTNSSC